MKKIVRSLLVLSLVVVGVLGTASVAFAGEPPEKTGTVVCPVLVNTGMAPYHSTQIVPIGEGHWTVAASTTATPMVPYIATNGDGYGTPPGPHSAPGDTDYTAIWAIPALPLD